MVVALGGAVLGSVDLEVLAAAFPANLEGREGLLVSLSGPCPSSMLKTKGLGQLTTPGGLRRPRTSGVLGWRQRYGLQTVNWCSESPPPPSPKSHLQVYREHHTHTLPTDP